MSELTDRASTDRSITRRGFVGTALVFGFAGCVSSPEETPQPSPSETTEPLPTETPEPPETTVSPPPETTDSPPPETTRSSPAETTQQPPPGTTQQVPVERGSWQLARVKVEIQRSYVGASAIVHNASTQDGSVRLRFVLYDPTGQRQYEGTDWVRIEAGEERHVARWWELDRPGTASPPIETADIEIIAVSA